MVPGFNTNIEWRGVLFHLQSEDSGRAHPHIISHLYHGGTILASEKKSYADQVEAEDLASVVRQLMEAQHEELLARLRAGDFDTVIEERLGPEVFAEPAPPGVATQPGAQVLEDEDDEAEEFEELLTVVAAETGSDQLAPLNPSRPLDEWVLDYLIQNAERRKAHSS